MDNCDVRLLSYVAATPVLYSAPVHAGDLCLSKVYARYMQQLDIWYVSANCQLCASFTDTVSCQLLSMYPPLASGWPNGTVDGWEVWLNQALGSSLLIEGQCTSKAQIEQASNVRRAFQMAYGPLRKVAHDLHHFRGQYQLRDGATRADNGTTK